MTELEIMQQIVDNLSNLSLEEFAFEASRIISRDISVNDIYDIKEHGYIVIPNE